MTRLLKINDNTLVWQSDKLNLGVSFKARSS